MAAIGRIPIIPKQLFTRSFVTSSSPLLRRRTLVTLAELKRLAASAPCTSRAGSRCYSTLPTTSSLNDRSPNWNNRPPKETILLDGCDFEHWLIVLEKPEGDPPRNDIIDSYIKTAAAVIGSEEEARKKIYSVSTRHYYAFGVIVSEEASYKFKELPKVRWVLPDSYLNVREKDYGGEPFIDGQAVPYDPKYHEDWVRNNARANERSRRNDRPRNNDRSRNFERRENMQTRDVQAPPAGNHGMQNARPNMGGPPAPNMQNGPTPVANIQNNVPSHGVMPPPNMQHNSPPNYQGMPAPNMQNSPPNYTVMPTPNMQNSPPNYGGMPTRDAGPPNMNVENPMPNDGDMPHRNAGPNAGYTNMNGGMPNAGPNAGYSNMNGGGIPNSGYSNNINMEGIPNRDAGPNAGYSNSIPNAGQTGNRDYQYRDAPTSGGMPYQSREGPVPMQNREYQSSYTPSMPGGNNAYQVRDIPGRD